MQLRFEQRDDLAQCLARMRLDGIHVSSVVFDVGSVDVSVGLKDILYFQPMMHRFDEFCAGMAKLMQRCGVCKLDGGCRPTELPIRLAHITLVERLSRAFDAPYVQLNELEKFTSPADRQGSGIARSEFCSIPVLEIRDQYRDANANDRKNRLCPGRLRALIQCAPSNPLTIHVIPLSPRGQA